MVIIRVDKEQYEYVQESITTHDGESSFEAEIDGEEVSADLEVIAPLYIEFDELFEVHILDRSPDQKNDQGCQRSCENQYVEHHTKIISIQSSEASDRTFAHFAGHDRIKEEVCLREEQALVYVDIGVSGERLYPHHVPFWGLEIFDDLGMLHDGQDREADAMYCGRPGHKLILLLIFSIIKNRLFHRMNHLINDQSCEHDGMLHRGSA